MGASNAILKRVALSLKQTPNLTAASVQPEATIRLEPPACGSATAAASVSTPAVLLLAHRRRTLGGG